MVFKAKTDAFIWITCAFVFVIYACFGSLIYYAEGKSEGFFGLGLIWVFLCLFIIWILPKSTRYTFLDEHLLCQTLFFKIRIPYSSFRKVEPFSGLYAGWKMNTAWKCLLVCYNKYDELLISPQDEAAFIELFEEKKAQFADQSRPNLLELDP